MYQKLKFTFYRMGKSSDQSELIRQRIGGGEVPEVKVSPSALFFN
jgi:hypothetical protein